MNKSKESNLSIGKLLIIEESQLTTNGYVIYVVGIGKERMI